MSAPNLFYLTATVSQIAGLVAWPIPILSVSLLLVGIILYGVAFQQLRLEYVIQKVQA